MNWLKEVEESPDLQSLLALVNDYILQQPDEFWTWIPRSSRPTLCGDENDLHYWHRQLAMDIAEATAPNIRMQDLCVFILRASARALELRRSDTRPSNDRAFGEESPAATKLS